MLNEVSTCIAYAVIALMGHVDEPVGNKWIVEPQRKGSFFDWSNVMDICVEESAMVDQQRLGISSLAQKKP